MKCKLLVAEDELIERKVLCKTLQKYLGDLIVLYEARNGREALELFEAVKLADASREEACEEAIQTLKGYIAEAGSGPQDPGDGQELWHPLPDRI